MTELLRALNVPLLALEQTLIPFLRDVLGRAYFNYSQDIMSLLAGGIDQSDAVFTDLVSSIDLTLQDVNESSQ